MRVLWVCREFGIGGAERLLLEFGPHATSVEFLPVAVSGPLFGIVGDLRRAGFVPRTLGSSTPFDPRWIGRLRRVIEAERPDVVHLNGPYPGAGGRLAVSGLGVPVVYTEHSMWESHRVAVRWANAVTFGRNDLVTAVSGAVKDSILRSVNGRKSADRIRVIRNGVDADRVRADAAAVPEVDIPPGTFGTVTHLTHRKGGDVLVRAARVVGRAFPDRRCVMVGGGPLRPRLERLSSRGGATGVSFLGWRRGARAIMARLSVFVLSSRAEGLPLALLEAMALARPIVASAVGGVPEAIEDGVTGLLVSPNDPEALAEAVCRLFREPDLAGRLGSAAREAVESRWHAHRMAGELLRAYEEVLARARRR